VAATDTSQGGDRVFGRIPKIVTDVQPPVVAVMVDNGEGSGVIFASDGTIVTSNHVVEGTQSVRVVFATGETVSARVVATDPLSDLAVLKAYRDGLPAVVPQSGAAAAGFRPGDDLRIEILRNGDDQTLTARLTNRPS
jgi:serine protease DegQ